MSLNFYLSHFLLMNLNLSAITDLTAESSADLLGLMDLKSVKEIHATFKLKTKSGRKNDLIKAMLENCNRQCTLTPSRSMDQILHQRICKKMCSFVKVSPEFYKLFHKIHLLYSFANVELNTANNLYLLMTQIKTGEVVMPVSTVQKLKVFDDAEEFSRYSFNQLTV